MDSRDRRKTMEDTTSCYQPETPPPPLPLPPQMCAKGGCGFFGSSALRNLCSKCYEDYLIQQLAMLSSSKVKPVSSTNYQLAAFCPFRVHEGTTVKNSSDKSTAKKNRCQCCKKRVGVTGFGCRCGGMFCGVHRYPETHSCTFDYKYAGRLALARQNPLCVGDKLENRI
ncbi:zinc finger A20 and AN1 domain-containing stress-associated protein 10-like [Cornus florida]|uniref:zinc finger A20 and AN1 domain-containing stress-associated protein 10-like n=1 Tax=Cornus florida TaxID=4283 RepID=UPI002898D36F|nr:zinc finger A20 and AN1 domain-containing stress-associated protein 10-like [Cornus florida]